MAARATALIIGRLSPTFVRRRMLRAFPELRAAVEGGELTRAHINVIVSVGEANATRRQLLGEFIEAFIEVGRRAPASVLRTVMRAWADQVDPLGTARDEDEAHRADTCT